jgi:hypothetical protein
VMQFKIQRAGVTNRPVGNWGMKKPELTDLGWLGPKDEMDRASHRFGKCSECHEIICVEKPATATENTQLETNDLLYTAFHTHVKLMHPEDSAKPLPAA